MGLADTRRCPVIGFVALEGLLAKEVPCQNNSGLLR